MVFDMTRESTLENAIRWYKEIKDAKNVPIVIVGNKADNEGSLIFSEEEFLEA